MGNLKFKQQYLRKNTKKFILNKILYTENLNPAKGGRIMADIKSEERIRQIVEVLDQLSEDTSVPRNIRRGAKESKELLLNTKEPLDVRTASASLILDDLANDPNIPLHGRTLIWNIINMLAQFEAPKE